MTQRLLIFAALSAASFALVNASTAAVVHKPVTPLRAAASAHSASFTTSVAPVLKEYCFGCHGNGKHKGDVSLDAWKSDAEALADRATWLRVLRVLDAQEMPPSNKPQPSAKDREQLQKWIETQVLHCDCERPDPGRVTLRRLNRAEYNNTIRDLLGVDFHPAQDFPVDDSGYGFDTIGDALSMPPILVEKYLNAAQQIVAAATTRPVAATTRYPVDALEVGYNAKQRGDGWVALNSVEEDDVVAVQTITHAGEYVWRVPAYARQDGSNAIHLTFMLDDKPVHITPVGTNLPSKIYEARTNVAAGRHRFRAVVRRIKDGLPEHEALKWKKGREQRGAVFVEWLEVHGPLHAESLKTATPIPSAPRGREAEAAREFLQTFAGRAFRRPAASAEVQKLVGLARSAWERGSSYEEGVALAMQAVLVSPHFLYRGELQREPDNPQAVHPVNEYALASRLSYFLWSSMPDDELFEQARRGTLRRNLDKQVRRMLRDAKLRALVDNFAGQWLQLRNLAAMAPDSQTFTNFDETLRDSMRRETELFVENLIREDRSVLEFLTADYTFVNVRLARHYGLQGNYDRAFQRVSLRETPRRGVLTHASVLTLTSNPTRTSPVKRGKWILDNVLNAPPPPPPPDVPELKEGKELTGTLRERMQQHRADTMCASCHARMDPIGFAFEHFDGIGAWREKERGHDIDASGSLTTGESFDGAGELIALLGRERQQQFVRALADKMLTYALGRGLEFYDKCALDEITKNAARRDYRFSAFVEEIAKSTPFQKRRGEGDMTAK
jgi:hypothetical protein